MKIGQASLFILGLALSQARGEALRLHGSDTLAPVIRDAITQAKLSDRLVYLGGGSGLGESAVVEGQQGIAPLSRAFKPALEEKLAGEGVKLNNHIIGLDGVLVFVGARNPLASLDLATVGRIFTCELTRWEDVPGSGREGAIRVYRRDAQSGTTDAFLSLVGIAKLGPCATEVASTEEMTAVTSREDAIGYAGLSGQGKENRAVALRSNGQSEAVAPSEESIRRRLYPLSRELHVYEVGGSRQPSEGEATFLRSLTDRDFLDPILRSHDFITLD